MYCALSEIHVSMVSLTIILLTYLLRMCTSICCSQSKDSYTWKSAQIRQSLKGLKFLPWLQLAHRQGLISLFELESSLVRLIMATPPIGTSMSRQWSSTKNVCRLWSLGIHKMGISSESTVSIKLTTKVISSPSCSSSFRHKNALPVLSPQLLVNTFAIDYCTHQRTPTAFPTKKWIASSAYKSIAKLL